MTLVADPALAPHHDATCGGNRPDDDVAAHMARYRPGTHARAGFRLPASEETDDVEAHGFKYPDALLGDDIDDVEAHGARKPADEVWGDGDVAAHGDRKPADPSSNDEDDDTPGKRNPNDAVVAST